MNRNTNFVSIDVIANKIYKNPLLKDVNFEDIIDYTLSVIRIARIPGVYKEESCYVEVNSHKALIPKNALNIKAVDHIVGNRNIPMTMSTYTLKNQLGKLYNNHNQEELDYRNSMSTYSINNQIINTSFNNGKIFILFDTIKVDKDDIPMIPDSEALLRAIEAYIKLQVYTVLADLNKVSERALNRAEQEYYFNIGKAQSEFQGFINEDHMEGFLNGWKRQFISEDEHKSRYMGESYKQHSRKL